MPVIQSIEIASFECLTIQLPAVLIMTEAQLYGVFTDGVFITNGDCIADAFIRKDFKATLSVIEEY